MFDIVNESILDVGDLDKTIEKSAAWAWLYKIFDKREDKACTWKEWGGIHANIRNQLSALQEITSRKSINILKKSGAILKFALEYLSIIMTLEQTHVPTIIRYRFSAKAKRTFVECFQTSMIKGKEPAHYYEIPLEIAKNILHHMNSNYNECNGVAPANTIGMGNPSMPTDTTPGSGDLPTAKTKKRKKFTEVIESVLDQDAGVDFEAMGILDTFKKKLKKYADINLYTYKDDIVDPDFDKTIKSLYNRTLKNRIQKTAPDKFKMGAMCQIQLKEVYKAPVLIISWKSGHNEWSQLGIRKRPRTDRFLCQEVKTVGHMPNDIYTEKAAYLSSSFATELAQFFKYRFVKFVG